MKMSKYCGQSCIWTHCIGQWRALCMNERKCAEWTEDTDQMCSKWCARVPLVNNNIIYARKCSKDTVEWQFNVFKWWTNTHLVYLTMKKTNRLKIKTIIISFINSLPFCFAFLFFLSRLFLCICLFFFSFFPLLCLPTDINWTSVLVAQRTRNQTLKRTHIWRDLYVCVFSYKLD